MDQGGSHRRRPTAGKRNRDGAGATSQSSPGQRLPALRARPVVRGSSEAPLEGGSVRDPFRRRCHLVLPAQGGRRKVLGVLPKRFAKFGLTLHPEKTRLIEFGRFAAGNAKKQGKKPETFDFLGFTHMCARSRKG